MKRLLCGLRRAIAIVGLVVAVVSCATLPQVREEPTLVVALYPYVPRVDQFVSAISDQWSQVQPNVPLKFITSDTVWDGGYNTPVPPEADIYVFDAMYFEGYRSNNQLEPMAPSEIVNAQDILSYARDGVVVDGQYYAIPLLGCSNILFYNKNDSVIAAAQTLSELKATLNQCTYTSTIPPDRRGLMMDMGGKTTNAALYLDIAHSVNGTYPLPLPSQTDPAYIANQQLMLELASYLNANYSGSNQYQRGDWFSDGYGRALVGFTESMSVMSEDTLADIAFKVMPMSDTTSTPPLFYFDAIGINTTTGQRGTRQLAVQLANVMAGTDAVVESLAADTAGANPQYLMAVRHSAFQQLAQSYPIYQAMYEMVQNANPVAFKLAVDGRTWVESMGGTIRTEVRTNYPCGCDQEAVQPIVDNAAAPPICTKTCENWGGWNGQWTNQPPVDGSVCGCNACPTN